MQCLRTRSSEEVSWQDLCTGSLYEISVAAVYKSSLGKISARDLMARSQQISAQCLCTRSWSEVSWQDLCTRPPRLSKFAPRHKERDPTCPKWREGYVSTCQIFTKHCAHHEIWTLKMSKTMLYLGLSHFFVEVCKVLSTAPAWPLQQKSSDGSLARNGVPEDLSSEDLVLRHSVWQAWHFRGSLMSKTSFCVAGAGHRTLSSAWQEWRFLHVAKTLAGLGQKWEVVLEVIFCGRRSTRTWWTWTTFWKGRKHRFVKLLSCLILDMMMIPCGRCSTSDASGSFFVHMCRPSQRPRKGN